MATLDPQEKVAVHIVWTERVHYDSTVMMTREAYEKFEALWAENDEDDRDVERALSLVDREADWQDSDDIEIDTFELASETEEATAE